MSRNRCYTFTLNNPSITKDELLDKIKDYAKVMYCIIGFEVGSKEHTPHLQGYVRFMNSVAFDSLRKNVFDEKAHLEVARNDDKTNKLYCSKDNDYVEYGSINDYNDNKLDATIIDDIINDLPYVEIIKKYYSYVLYHYKDFKELYKDLRGFEFTIFNNEK